MAYVRVSEKCDSCGESGYYTHPDIPKVWHDGTRIVPLKNKTVGVKCPACRWTDFDDFCSNQGVSSSNPVKHID